MMALFFVVGFLLFSLVGRISAGGSEQTLTHLSNCGSEREYYDELSDGLLKFFVSHHPVHRGLICDVLELLISNGCSIYGGRQTIEWRRIGEEYCSGSSAVGFNSLTGTGEIRQISGRKILLELSKSGIVGGVHRRGGQWKDKNGKHEDPPLPSKRIVIAVPAAFLLCCAFLCPCFQKTERDVPEEPLRSPKTGKNSTSSEHFKVSRRMPGSGRMPGSPLRAPPSPLRVSASPSRFATQQLSISGPMQFKMKQIRKATQNFSELHAIGEGGFGMVYKAELLDGLVVAVKRARKEHFSTLQAEFRNEIQFLSQIEHQSLVRLLGYIDKENERIIISEYVPNGNLREHLDGRDGRVLDFSQRLAIAIDIAHGLTYLHLYAAEKPIIHRDVKSTNILLTENLRAKVADFGFARSGPSGEDQTHISTGLKGTAGYVDPEYLRTYKLTPKSDVFSFGVLLIEIISGRRPIEAKRPSEERVTVRWAFRNYSHGNMREILDPDLEEEVPEEALSRLLELAFECAAPTHKDRPSMKEVGEILWDIRREHVKSRNGVHMSSG